MKKAVGHAAMSAAALLSSATALPCAAADDWAWSGTVYAWLPSIVGSSRFDHLPGGGSIDVAPSPNEYLKSLNFAFMGTVEARRGPYSLLLDGIYLNLGKQDATVRSISGPGGAVTVPVDTGSQLATSLMTSTATGSFPISS